MAHRTRESNANPFIRRNDRRISTQSRTEAAALLQVYCNQQKSGFNTQPREDGCLERGEKQMLELSFNTQPHGGGCYSYFVDMLRRFCFNTQPHGGGCRPSQAIGETRKAVSTHSHAKAAAYLPFAASSRPSCFNTQPRGGGCLVLLAIQGIDLLVSTHSRAEAAAFHQRI